MREGGRPGFEISRQYFSYETYALALPRDDGAIRAHLQRLGARYLGRGDTLRITVLDLDLAGHDLSSTGLSRLRVLNGATPPKITHRYRLLRNHKLVASGEDSLLDHSYLSRPGTGLSSDELQYEKTMLDDWFREKFSAGRTPAR